MISIKKNTSFLYIICSLLFFSSRTMGQVLQKQSSSFLNDSVVATGHAGISIYEPATGKYLYDYNAEKNFIPSSNLKLFSLYAGLKYLGDSLLGLKYIETDTSITLIPTGDPTLLHPDFSAQPVFEFLKATKKNIYLAGNTFKTNMYGNGWGWNDYPDYYMAERSAFPVYGNCITFNVKKNFISSIPENLSPFIVNTAAQQKDKEINVERVFFSNTFKVLTDNKTSEIIITPFITSDSLSAKLLSDSTHKNITVVPLPIMGINKKINTIYSRPVDSLFKPMMYNSDNFFAEQTLMMVSNKVLGYMNETDLIDSLLKTDLKDLPQKPRWVDGSGLSRYNLFTPKDFIYILYKLQKEFGLERIKRILPTAGMGTLRGYYENAVGSIYAKTGSMSNNVSLSGYLISKKNKLLLFSVMINNYSGSGKQGRKAIEKFIQSVRNSY